MGGGQPTRYLRGVLKSMGPRAGSPLPWEGLVMRIIHGALKQLTYAWVVREGFLKEMSLD